MILELSKDVSFRSCNLRSIEDHARLQIKQIEDKPGGIVIYEGSVENESLPELFHEGSLWHSSEVCKVTNLLS